MKKHLTFFAVLSFLLANAQFKQGTIYLKDGNTQEGLIKTRTLGGIKYKNDKDSEVQLYDYNHINGYDITENGIKKYRYKKVGSSFPRIMKIVRLGKINLYSIFVSNAGSAMGMGLPVSEGNVYFLEKNNITIRAGGKIKNGKLYLFEDCPDLIQKIKKKEIKKREVYKIVDFYNKNCN